MRFHTLSPTIRQIPIHYSPVRHSTPASKLASFPFDLHVLGMPPAFNLSHDQTLQFNLACYALYKIKTSYLIDVVVLLCTFACSCKYSTSVLVQQVYLCKYPHTLFDIILLKSICCIAATKKRELYIPHRWCQRLIPFIFLLHCQFKH